MPSSLMQPQDWHRSQSRKNQGSLFCRADIAGALLLDSGVLCSYVVREAQLILRLLKNKGFKEERMTKIGLYAIGRSKTMESNKSQVRILLLCV